MSSEGQALVAEELIDSLDHGRFELYRDSELVGWLYYTHLKPNRYALRHTRSSRVINTRAWRARWCGEYSTRSAPARARSPQSAPLWSTTSRERPPMSI